MKILLPALTCLALLAAIAFGGLYAYGQFAGPGPLAASADIEIPHGTGVRGVAQQLAAAGIIRRPLIFTAAAALTHQGARLQAGEYAFPPHATMREVMAAIAHGTIVRRTLTVPEGLTSWQIVQALNAAEVLSGEIGDTPADGTLLPQTYQYMRGDTRAAQIAKMQGAMAKTLAELWAARDPGVPLATPAEAVTLASIVEKETGVASERATVAGLFENRLRQHMLLQSDPTVIYALTKGEIQSNGQGPLGRRLLTADLATDSPYNTYKYAGLPPGPICNPGREALEAVLHPAHNNYLYFVASPTGGHVFASTLDEQTRNVQTWHDFRKETGR